MPLSSLLKLTGKKLRGLLLHPLASDLDVNSDRAIEIHRKIIQDKALLKWVYASWYKECSNGLGDLVGKGPIIEIGCGAGFLDQAIPGLIKTDSVPNPNAHRVMNADKLDAKDGEVAGLCLIAVLHHLYQPSDFLREAERVLRPGGRLVLVEPSYCWLQDMISRYLNHYEYYDVNITEWKNLSSERMTRANLALPWVIFIRDQEKFKKMFPKLKIRSIRYHTFLAYMLSGGVSFRSFVPSFGVPLVALFEWLMTPLMKKLSSMMTIVIEREP